MDSEDVNRILDNLSEQNGEDVTLWFWGHVCSVCGYRKEGLKKQ